MTSPHSLPSRVSPKSPFTSLATLGASFVAISLGLTFVGASAMGAPLSNATKSATKNKTTKKSTTKKSTTKSTSGATTTTKKGAVRTNSVNFDVTTTVKPTTRSAGTPVAGFGLITPQEFPALGAGVIAKARTGSLNIYKEPENTNGFLNLVQGQAVSGPVALMAIGGQNGWVKVAVPVRPNGTTAWVKASDVELIKTSYEIIVELSSNTLFVYDGTSLILKTAVATGTSGTPTPTGLFFVKENVPQANPKGGLGPVALGTSGYSTVLSDYGGGQGAVGIHGTSAPGKLGTNASHGCIRVVNTDIVKIADMVPLGTPVAVVKDLSDLATNRAGADWVSSVGTIATTTTLTPLTSPAPTANPQSTNPQPTTTQSTSGQSTSGQSTSGQSAASSTTVVPGATLIRFLPKRVAGPIGAS